MALQAPLQFFYFRAEPLFGFIERGMSDFRHLLWVCFFY
jgi:hypothetical protein